jgi:deoxyribose-phosphate aldolase
MGVKAAGGVKTLEDAEAMIEAGANRIGTSGGIKILKGETASGGY